MNPIVFGFGTRAAGGKIAVPQRAQRLAQRLVVEAAVDEVDPLPRDHGLELVLPLAEHRLVDILHSWKSFTANEINRRVGKTGPLWQHESYDHIVRNERAMDAIRRYIRENPVAGDSGYVAEASTANVTKTSSPKVKIREQALILSGKV